jgi:hypothetical protein
MNVKVDITEQELIDCYTRQWVIEWCKKYHPEAFEEAKKFIKETISVEDEK